MQRQLPFAGALIGPTLDGKEMAWVLVGMGANSRIVWSIPFCARRQQDTFETITISCCDISLQQVSGCGRSQETLFPAWRHKQVEESPVVLQQFRDPILAKGVKEPLRSHMRRTTYSAAEHFCSCSSSPRVSSLSPYRAGLVTSNDCK